MGAASVAMISCAARTTIVVEEEETLCFFTALLAREMDARAVMDWQACILSVDVHFFCVGREREVEAKREGHVWGEKRETNGAQILRNNAEGAVCVLLRFGLRDYRFR